MSFGYVFDALRAHYRARGLRYRDVAAALDVSEATIKRIFSERDCTLARLEQLCGVAEIDLAEVARGLPRQTRLLTRLTRQQEQDLVDNTELFIVAICAMANMRFEEMIGTYRLTAAKCVKLLARLDRIGFLELLPENRYRLLVARSFAWIPDGPIMRWTKSHAAHYFDHPFVAPGETMRVVNVRVSAAAQEALLARIDQLAHEYAEQHNADAWLPPAQRRPLSLCIAVRSWEPEPFLAMRRREPKAATAARTRHGPTADDLALRGG